MTLNNNKKTPPPPPAQRPSNIERLTQWREIAERTGNAKLNTVDILEIRYANEVTLAHYNGQPINLYVDILEIRYANEATRPPVPPAKGGDA